MSRPIEKWLAVGFAAVSLAVAAILIVTLRNARHHGGLRQGEEDTVRIVGELEDLLDAVVEAQSSTHSFVITGDRSHWDQCRQARDRMKEHLQRLQSLVATGHSGLLRALPELSRMIDIQIAYREHLLDVIEQQGVDAGRAIVSSGGNQENLDAVDRLISSLQAEEQRRLRKEREALDANDRQASVFLASLSVLIVALLLSAYVLLWRFLRKRRMAEQALHISEERFRLLVSQVEDYSIIFLDPNGYVESWNAGAQRIKGFSEAEILGKHFSIFYPLEDAEAGRPQAALEAAAQNGVFRDEGQRVRKGGVRFWADVTLTALHDAHGALRGFSKLTRDITERKRVETELAQYREHLEELVAERTAQLGKSEERYTIVADKTYDWEFWIAEDGRILYMSPSCQRITGYLVEQFVDDPEFMTRIIHPEDQPIYRDYLRRMTAGRYSDSIAFRIIRADGEARSIEQICQPVFDETGGFMGMRGSNRDVTNRLRIEAELRRVHAAIEDAHDAVAIVEPGGAISYMNIAFGRLFKHTRDTIAGAAIETFFSDPEIARRLHRAALDGLGESLEVEVLDTSGKPMPALLRTAGIMDEKCEVSAALFMFTDITERKRAEFRLNASLAELERSNRDLEQFAYVASHDLQEPLRLVSAYTQLLLQRYRDKLDSEADPLVNFITEGVNRMQRLVQDLLLYSRVGTRGKPFAPVDSGKALDEALKNLAMAIQDQQAVVTRDDLPTVASDAMQLTMLFQNLIGNAIKFRGGENPLVHVGAGKTEDGAAWLFSVSDNGIGIDAEFAERIIVIFQRLHTRSKYPGTGIGLALCKRIVERHGGRIWVEPGKEKGSVFWFTIPLDATGEPS